MGLWLAILFVGSSDVGKTSRLACPCDALKDWLLRSYSFHDRQKTFCFARLLMIELMLVTVEHWLCSPARSLQLSAAGLLRTQPSSPLL